MAETKESPWVGSGLARSPGEIKTLLNSKITACLEKAEIIDDNPKIHWFKLQLQIEKWGIYKQNKEFEKADVIREWLINALDFNPDDRVTINKLLLRF